ncbi:LuxR C-terminal-related transcriptional regulator [Streptomyces sp. NPDC052701]|uniref:helix-turn-helix transcriptional regulator n=1 Tax=Streptomyces sp. NPDC052701 TaxID=3155533 RepID=UPI00341AB00F
MTGQTTPRPAPLRYRAGTRRQAVAELLDRLRAEGAVHVVTGEPGCGRTAFLESAARCFTPGPVVRVRSDPAWARQPYGGLRALSRALGRPAEELARPGPGPAGEALFGALRAAGAQAPLLVCVDDAHLWDAASRAALGEAGIRLHTAGRAGLGLLLTVAGHRPPDREFAGLPVLRLGPLAPADAAALVDDATDGAVDPAVRDELVAEAEGSPALLLALVRRLSPAQLGGCRPLPRPLADAEALTAAAGRCLAGLPPEDDGLLLTVAAALHASGEADTDAGVVLRAVEGTGDAAGAPAPDHALAARAAADPPGSGGVRVRVPGPGRRAAGARGDGGDAPARTSLLVLRTDASLQGGQEAPAPDPRPAPGEAGGPPAEPAPVTAPVTARVTARVTAPVTPEPLPVPDTLVLADGRFRFRSALFGRAVYAAAAPERRRAAHRALARALPGGHDVLALLHRSWAATGPDAALAAALSAAADSPAALPHALRRTAHLRAAELTPEESQRAHRYTAAAEQALLAGDSCEALRLLDRARSRPAAAVVRGRAELLRGTALLADGPVDDARESLLLAARLLAAHDPEEAASAALAAADAAWAAGDLAACLRVLDHDGPGPSAAADGPEPSPGERRALLHDHREGMRAVLRGRFDLAAGPLGRVVDRCRPADDPGRLLRSATAALLLGDVTAARRAGARALAAARTLGSAALEPRALEYLAYAELRAGRHALARTHAEEGLRSAHRTGQRNTAAQHHAILALAASIEGETDLVAGHVSAALTTARRHGLAQAATLAQWAAARADLGRGRPREAADRLGPLVRPGPRRGHFAVWMLAVPCFVEAAALSGQPEHARAVVEDFALWAACDADPQAPAQLLRCRALLAAPEAADELYRRALDRHEETAGDFERARTELLYGKWLRRRRRLREARTHLGAALMGFERCGARRWAQQAGAELRANGAAPSGTAAGEPARAGAERLARLTPQQLRIVRCVAEGATNREVALSLSVSTRTVDYHLRNVFAALGVRSRVELARMVEQADGPPPGSAHRTGAQL